MYRIEITENGKTWLLPAEYTEQEAEWEVKMQYKLNSLNAIAGEEPATFRIIEE